MTTDSPLIPREVLLGNPTRVMPRLAPDGDRLAYLAPRDGVLNVWVAPIGSDDARVVTDDRERGIREFFWSPDGRRILYVQDQGGDENWRLYDVDIDTGTTRDLTPFEKVQTQVLHVDENRPDAIVVGLNRDDSQLHDAYRLDLATGELTKLATNPGFAAWVVDNELVPRAGFAPTPDGGFALVVAAGAVAEDADVRWEPRIVFDGDDALSVDAVGFSADNRTLYLVHAQDANAARLVSFDLDTGAQTTLFGDERYDLAAVGVHPHTKEPRLVAVARDRVEITALDPTLQADLDALRAVQSGDFGIEDRDRDDRTWLVRYTTDDGPVSYYAFDRSTKTATFLFDHRDDLRKYELVPMEPFSFTARDGLEVHGYLTFPPGERHALPTVLNVHGGPWARDLWGFNPEAQLLANRGYLCVQVNFRGSTGYGKDFVNAGDREWGAKMQDDLLDAVDHVIASGFADPDRVAIYGGSYGGYAALVGATFTPERFACIVDIVGPSNLVSWSESIPAYWEPMRKMLERRVGADEDFLRSRSPLSRVDAIARPLLIAQGANDPRVPQAESEQIVAAMKDKGIDHEYLLFPDEGHGFARPENRLRFYAAAERFLARHLGGRFEE